MNIGLYSAISGSKAEETRLEVTANNIANMSTVGYKKDIPLFKAVLSSAEDTMQVPPPGISFASSEEATPVFKDGYSFVVFDQLKTDFAQGTLTKTDNKLDVAIDGDGFFIVETPQGMRYTRQGNFTIDESKRLITQEGFPVMSDRNKEIVIEGNSIEIKSDGEIYIDGVQADKLGVVDFEKPYTLKKIGNCLFESENQNQGFDAKEFQVKQGFRELSNVDMIKEMVQMISILRSYQSYQKIIKTTMETVTSRAVNDVGNLQA